MTPPLALAASRLWMRSLDSFIRCTCPGCEWHVRPPYLVEARCKHHGGGDWPQYVCDEDGAILDACHMADFIEPEPD